MRIYAIRDRLIDYFMTPFAAPNDKEVLGSIAYQINLGEAGNAIAQAPHHYEVWKLAEVTEDGHIVPNRELIADCASLVRAGIRGTSPAEPRAGAAAGAGNSLATAPGIPGADGAANPDPVQGQAHATPQPRTEAPGAPARGHSSSDEVNFYHRR